MELYELNLYEVIEGLQNKKFSAQELFNSCKNRINLLEKNINAFITRTDENLNYKNDSDGILKGVPTVLKDNLCTQGIKTTAASKILGEWKPPYSATVWNLLQDSGAVLMGKTNMDEFAMGNTCGNSAYGPTKNPNDITRVPGGSSGGSAAAVSAGYVPFGLGSDTGGSIRQPASCCGIVGVKPTYGRVSRFGAVAFASSLDQIGPMSKTVEDSALLLNVIGLDSPLE